MDNNSKMVTICKRKLSVCEIVQTGDMPAEIRQHNRAVCLRSDI